MYAGLVAALAIALLLTVISVIFLGRRGPWGTAWTFFLVLFLALWTVSIYVSPIGPVYLGIAWIPIIFSGLLVAILLIAVMPGMRNAGDQKIRETETGKVGNMETSDTTGAAIGSFFWILIILFIIAIIIGIINPSRAL